MDGGGDGDGGLPAKRAKLSPAAGAGDRRDHISDLPDDLLVLILLRLPTNYAARTSVLSRRWRRVWTRLPVLTFECGDSGAAPVLAALAACAAHGDTDIQSLTVSSIDDAAPEATASWLRLATPLLSGALHFHNRCSASVWELNWELDEEVMVERGAFELPCFKKATKIWFKLGFLGLALPPAGVFDALTVLCLENFRFQGQFSLSYTMCPSLQELSIKRTLGRGGASVQALGAADTNASALVSASRLPTSPAAAHLYPPCPLPPALQRCPVPTTRAGRPAAVRAVTA